MMKKLVSPFGAQGWYPDSLKHLQATIQNSLTDGIDPHVRAAICPHAGYRWCSETLGRTMSRVGDVYDNVLLLGPSHRVGLHNQAIVCDYTGVETPLGVCEISGMTSDLFINNNRVHDNEHSTLMHVPYIQYCCPSATVTPVIIGSMDEDYLTELARTLSQEITDKTLIMISSDFTHYGEKFKYTPFDRADNLRQEIYNFDHKVIEMIVDIETDLFKLFVRKKTSTICGKHAIAVMLQMIRDMNFTAELCDYSMSGDMVHDHTNSVSYAGIIFKSQ